MSDTSGVGDYQNPVKFDFAVPANLTGGARLIHGANRGVDARVGAYRDAMVKPAPKAPDTTPAEDAARMDRTNAAKQGPADAKDAEAISTLSDRNQTLLRNVMESWMKKNPGKVPKKKDVASQMGFFNEEHVAAMYRILSREE